MKVPRELANDQAQRRVKICKQLLANPQDFRLWRQNITGDKKMDLRS